MESLFSLPLWSLLFVFPVVMVFYRRRNHWHLPPGPKGWPIFGNMFDLGTMPHRTLAALANKHGPILWLKLGSQNTLVIQTAGAAEEFFKHHDLSFADRNINETMRVLDWNKGSMVLSPYNCSYWRSMRKLCTLEMLTSKRISETASVREKCVDSLIKWIKEAAVNGEGQPCSIEVSRFVFLAEFNLFGNLVLSRDLVDPNSQEGSEFFAAMTGVTQWTGVPNVADFFPWLKWLDLQGLNRKTKREMTKTLNIASAFLEERIRERKLGANQERRDFLDVLLDFQADGTEGSQIISDKQLHIFITEFFMVGTESTGTTIEWAFTELLAHQDAMSKVKEELNKVVGQRRFREADIDATPYLQAVIKETLRLHPPTPFLVPRKAVENVKFMGYDIPQGTQVFVNAWAIGRDPERWDDPSTFKPERFLGSSTDYKGQHYELIPFGAGRRMCAAVSLAHTVLNLLMGTLLHHFDWELESSVTSMTIDMRDRLGLTARKLVPLKAIPSVRKE